MGVQDSAAGTAAEQAASLLRWYDRHRRSLPWRAEPGAVPDPYAVWLSEVMLQQTTVAAVKGYYADILATWPRVEDLAAAPLAAVLKRWAGLGYYSRARNLHACARRVAADGGRFPDTEAGLRALPGIGAYTAAAIAAIAFGRRAVVVDANVERVIVRLHAMATPIRDCRPAIRVHADALTPPERCGDFAQAMMDLGATVCTPRNPACALCPLAAGCGARRQGRERELPVRSAKPAKRLRRGSVFYCRRWTAGVAEVMVRTRPPRGLLGGMVEFPGSAWDEAGDPEGLCAPGPADWQRGKAPVEHGFTHFSLELTLFVATAAVAAPPDCRFVPERELSGLPTLMRNVAAAAQELLAEEATPAHLPLLAGMGA